MLFPIPRFDHGIGKTVIFYIWIRPSEFDLNYNLQRHFLEINTKIADLANNKKQFFKILKKNNIETKLNWILKSRVSH